MLRKVELAGNKLLYLLVGKVIVEFGKCAEGCQFKRLPCGRKFSLSIWSAMLSGCLAFNKADARTVPEG